MKSLTTALALSLMCLFLSACSSDEDKAPATAQNNSTAKKDFPKAGDVPTSNKGTVTNVDQVPGGLASDPNRPKYAEPEPKTTVAAAPRPNTAPAAKKQPANAPASAGASAPSSAQASASPSAAAPASGARTPILRGDYSGRAPFPGETGYLYGAYPRVQPRTTAQALYISPYSGQGRNAPQPLQGGSIYFANNSADLSPQDRAQLQGIANAALTYGKILQISGHASADRSAEAKARNSQLSAARAQNVAAQLQAWGVPASMIQITAYGDGLASARGQTGPADRRVDIFFVN